LVAATNMKTLPSFMPKPEIHSNSQRDVSSAWAALYKKISRDGSRQICFTHLYWHCGSRTASNRWSKTQFRRLDRTTGVRQCQKA
jgi:hypothetical protein